MNRLVMILAAAVFLSPAASSAADTGYRGWGPRLGATVDPDQFHFGAHVDYGHIADHVRLQPNVELGLGDGLTLLAVNLEGAYRFSSKWDSWTPYLGGGPGVNFIGTDDEGLSNGSDTEVGLNLLGGIDRGLASGNRFFMETKLGLSGSPDFKFTVGWTFPHGSAKPIPGER